MAIVASAVFGTFGIVSIVGGAIGFKKAGSTASLIAGTVCGAALLGASICVAQGALGLGLLLGGGTSLLLAGRFVPGYLRTRQVTPHGIMASLSAAGILTTLLSMPA